MLKRILIALFIGFLGSGVTSVTMAQLEAELNFSFADTDGNPVPGICLSGLPIFATVSVCDNQDGSGSQTQNAASDEDPRLGFIRIFYHSSTTAVSMTYDVASIPSGYQLVWPSDGVISVTPLATSYMVTFAKIGVSQSQGTSCQIVELYPGYPGYRGVVPGLVGAGDTGCLADLERLNPGFSKATEDAANEAVARQLGVQGSEQNWTWEIWMAIGAERGYGSICFFCLMSDPTIEPLGPGVSDGIDPRLAMPLRPAVATYTALGGDAVPNPQLLLDLLTDRDWERVRAFFLRIEALPTATALLEALPMVQSGLMADLDVVSCNVGKRGGYALVSPGTHSVDQMWMYALGELGMAISGGSPLQQMISSGEVSNILSAWTLGDGSVPLADYIRSYLDYSSCGA